jgi:hypothetical protein
MLGGFAVGGGARDPVAHPTVLDGAGSATSVVHLAPGSDGTTLEGFVITGGEGSARPDGVRYGGGILVEDAAPILRDNVIEDNHACYGGGIALLYSAARPAASVVGNEIRRNGFPSPRPECARGKWAGGGGVYVSGPPGADLGVVLSGNRISGSLWGSGAVVFVGGGSVEHDIVESSLSAGLRLSGGPLRVFNVSVTRNEAGGILLECGGDYRLENVTVADNAWGVGATGLPSATALTVETSVLWNNTTEVSFACSGAAPVIASSLIEGGYPGGTNIIDTDPLFAPGPLGDYYLSQASAGQPTTSPAVDAGSRPASDQGLDQRTTATDSVPDTGTVDLGYHPPRVASLTIERGTTPDALTAYRTVAGLSFEDDAGSLSDPSLPVLFYNVPGARNELGVQKNVALDAVRLVFLGR